MPDITIISLNFYPEDTAIGLYSTQMANYLRVKGYNITVVSAFPYYPKWKIHDSYRKRSTFIKEDIGGIRIYRYKQYVPQNPSFFKRSLHMLDFSFGSFINAFKVKKSDLVICVVPFTFSIWAAKTISLRRNAPLWIHIQDFEFEAAMQTGLSSEKSPGLFKKLLFFVERRMLKMAKYGSSISDSMMKKLKEKSGISGYFLPNWIDENFVSPSNFSFHEFMDNEKFNILYSGNIGAKQDWDFFNKYVERLQEFDDIRIIVVGDGAMRKEVEKASNNFSNIVFYDPVPYSRLSDLLCSADLHILFQKSEVVDTVMPSKLLGMMASEVPSIVTGSLESEVAEVFKASRGGFFFDSNDLKSAIDATLKLRSERQLSDSIGIEARKFVVENYSKDKVLSKFEKHINAILENEGRTEK